MIISKKAFDAAIERASVAAFREGYEAGELNGKREAMQSKITPNMLREYLGLSKVEQEANNGE